VPINQRTPDDLHLPPNQLGVSALAFGRDAKTLVSASFDNKISLWDLSRKTALVGTGHKKPVTAVALHPNGQIIFSAGYDGLREWAVPDSGSETVLREGWKYKGTFETLALSRNGTYLAASRDDAPGRSEVCVWKTGALDSSPECREGAGVTAATFSRAENALLATGSENGTILLTDVASMRTKQTLLAEGKVTTLAFNDDDTMLAAGRYSGSIQVWDLHRPGAAPVVLRGPGFSVLAVAFRHVDNKLVSVSSDGNTFAWSLPGALYNRICRFATRPFTPQEWDRFLPGYSRNHTTACQEAVAAGKR
jgi:WD40 repeat protein